MSQLFQRKICLLGSFSVGKSSLVRRFVEGNFDEKYHSTIGVKISRRSVDLAHCKVNLMVWDLAGGDDNIRSSTNYLLGSAGALIVCDLTRSETLSLVEKYIYQVRGLNSDIKIVMLANKKDIEDKRQISPEMLAEFVGQFDGIEVIETSAKTGENVEDAFAFLANQLVSA